MMKALKLITFITVAIFIAAFIYRTDFEAMQQSMTDFGFYFVVLIPLTALAYLMGTWGWRYCLPPNSRNISLHKLFMVRQVGETISLFNPSNIIAGDLFKIKILKSSALSQQDISQSVFLSRVIAIMSQLLLLITVLIWFGIHNMTQSTNKTLAYICLFTTLLLLLLVFGFFIAITRFSSTTTSIVKTNLITRLRLRLFNTLQQTSLFYKENKRSFWHSFLCFTLHWFIGSLEFYLIIRLLGIHITVFQGLFIDMGAVLIKSLGAFVPAQIGIEEFGNKIMLTGLGITSVSIWLNASLLRRARQLVWIAISGIYYIKLNKIYGNPVRQS
ncbi:lysylphosphatidylglycerol synthase transmembrane domain-containing protein [Sphingobacterium sp. SYP-B4668]|uniref:lysylphosphatidylglycerol synthase transmembrane domain-containing protein n=1 Tax=Sphingobacterium sp. SYP-B4668 TaxID=2996035 RepID=UPI0022DDE686|nr:lysylphosphatidylglycerol synthase transmembrane domain-containing protein [Sphingobacterium sp. SYP-B4668]